jgi:RNA polymerase sigma factor (sigma-70 family)
VLAARGDTPEARATFSELCAAYYAPVLAFVRRATHDDDAAQDLTQGFFAQLIAHHGLDTVEPGHGRFRSYLLGAVKNYLIKQHDYAAAAKRGGGQVPLSIQGETDTSLELQIPDPTAVAPDTVFDREWARAVVARAVATLAAELVAAGKGEQFKQLKPWLLGEVEGLSQAEAARRLEISEGAVKVAIHRLRKRFREVLKEEVAQTLDNPTQVREELRYLVEVLSA